VRILITGSRTTTAEDDAYILDRVKRIAIFPDHVTLVDGDCASGGADHACRAWADEAPHVTIETHPADWKRLGRDAGPARNQEMVDLGADLCLAFPRKGSRGTWDCIQRAAEAGIPVHIYPLKED
jgi:hypothetical protein